MQPYTIRAACLSNIGRRRKNNEDNFYFCGDCLEEENSGLTSPLISDVLSGNQFFAVFDGMGGENFGECASYAAAHATQELMESLSAGLVPYDGLDNMAQQLNEAVLTAQKEKCTNRMGTTMVGLFFSSENVYAVNLGDSRAYCFRAGQLCQLSQDHVSNQPMPAGRKAPLTQHLGIDPEDMLIEPYIAQSRVLAGDKYMLCSDGLTDMVPETEIMEILSRHENASECVSLLVESALAHGGRDNVTVIVCTIQSAPVQEATHVPEKTIGAGKVTKLNKWWIIAGIILAVAIAFIASCS